MRTLAFGEDIVTRFSEQDNSGLCNRRGSVEEQSLLRLEVEILMPRSKRLTLCFLDLIVEM